MLSIRTPIMRPIGLARNFATTSRTTAVKPRPSSTASASQPVSKRNAPPAPAPPTRPPPRLSPTPAPGPTSAAPESSSKRGGKEGSVFASYKALPYNTKLVFWTCGAGVAAMGLLAADKLEELFPARNNRPPPTAGEESGVRYIEHEGSRKPKLFSVSVVDRAEPQPQAQAAK